jgi:hypothetical protein
MHESPAWPPPLVNAPTCHDTCLKLRLIASKHDVGALLHHKRVIVRKWVAGQGVRGSWSQVPPR